MRKLLLFAVLLAVLAGCKTKERIVTVEKVRTDTTYITKHERDSIWLHDSIKVSEKGDTVRIEKWHTKYVESIRHDTIYQATHDTIPQPYKVTEYVERKLTKPQKCLMFAGIIALMALVLWGGWKLSKLLPRR